MNNDQIQEEINSIKKEYSKAQRLRNNPSLTEKERKNLTTAQTNRVRRVAKLENLLSQRFAWN